MYTNIKDNIHTYIHKSKLTDTVNREIDIDIRVRYGIPKATLEKKKKISQQTYNVIK